MRKFCFSIGFLFLSFLFLPSNVAASEDFSISGKATYEISSSGTTSVEHQFQLVNKKSDKFATNYALSIASTKIDNVWAKDDLSDITPKKITRGNQTVISVEFQKRSLGVGQVLNFSIGYQDLDVSQKIGRIWEINIAQPGNLSDFQEYKILLQVPKHFKQPILLIPEKYESSTIDEFFTYSFSKNSLSRNGVTAIFGEKQVFSFDLRYTIQNPGPIKKDVEIALPPDTYYQKLFYDSISPEPENIRIDNDGNWIAIYNLKAGQVLEINTSGQVLLSLFPENLSPSNYPDLKKYLKAEPPWPKEDPEIKELANNLKTPKNIYEYVVQNLTYNFERISESNKRLGALGALTNPDQAICMEFTDLFITIARAAGIPSRELNGFAYTNNPNLRPLSLRQDILHSWPEYFDSKKGVWIPVDPTWGNTTKGIDYFSKFDLNHIVFVIHGESSQLPFPAGFYKVSDEKGKDIIIVPSDNIPIERSDLDLKIELPEKLLAGLPKSGNLILINRGNTSRQISDFNISSQGEIDILSQQSITDHQIAPFSKLEISFRVKGVNLFKNSTAKIIISVDGEKNEKIITIEPIQSKAAEASALFILGAAITFLPKRTRSLLLSFFKK
jgi:transglutaminase-like putative cysteine protease